MDNRTYGFVGLGLIGGSIARAIRVSEPEAGIIAYTPHRRTVDSAYSEGIIDTPLYSIGEEFRSCDYIFLCAPVEINNDNLRALVPFLDPSTTITDIGSVKTGIHELVKELHLEDQFIGGHPMAGTERIGFANSSAGILENAYYIITRTDSTDEKRLEDYVSLVKALRCIPLVVPYRLHDYITAAISHVPHVISASLVNLVKDSDNEEHLMKTIAAGGFKDITRISSSSPQMWNQICMTNSGNITELLDKYIDSLKLIRAAISGHDEAAVTDFFSTARDFRESFTDISSGPIRKVYKLSVEIDDRPGNLVAVATLLSNNNINIKNIGIVHNREYQRGTLMLELHDKKGLEQSFEILGKAGYNCYKDS